MTSTYPTPTTEPELEQPDQQQPLAPSKHLPPDPDVTTGNPPPQPPVQPGTG